MEIEMNEDPGFEIPGDDPMDIARHRFRKGRFEFMAGGPIIYEQGHGYKMREFNIDTMQPEEKTCVNQTRYRGYAPGDAMHDPIAKELGVDVQE